MRVEEKSVAKYVVRFASEYVQRHHRGHKISGEWIEDYIKNYETLKQKYKDCFGEKRVRAILDEHKVLASFLIAIQMTDYPVDHDTNKFRKELLAIHVFERMMKMFNRELHLQTRTSTYEKAYQSDFKYPEKINGKDDYRRQFVKSLFFAFANDNKDIFNLSNVIFLLEQFNFEYWKSVLIKS